MSSFTLVFTFNTYFESAIKWHLCKYVRRTVTNYKKGSRLNILQTNKKDCHQTTDLELHVLDKIEKNNLGKTVSALCLITITPSSAEHSSTDTLRVTIHVFAIKLRKMNISH